MSTSIRTVALLTGLIVALFTWRHRDFYFGPAQHEVGDFAANALQIDDAIEFQTVHGHYSRWGFNHPGPVFFYAYAASELLLFRAVPVFRSPHQAHAFAGLLIQALFFAAGIRALSTGAKSIFDPLALLAATLVYFADVEGAFTSIWPPHALMGPFFAFVCSCAALAAGMNRALPLAVVAASFLVHGHVAQPLLVVPLLAGAYAWRTIRDRRSSGIWFCRTHAREHVLAGVLLALFALPLAIDALAGADSNAFKILEHLARDPDDGKRLSQSIGHFLSFFFRDARPEAFLDAGDFELWRYVGQHWIAFGAWAAIAGLALVAAFATKESPATPGVGLDRRILGVFWLGAAVLSLVWGMLQRGEMFSFNSVFVHSLALLLAIQALIPVVEYGEQSSGRAAAIAVVTVGSLVVLLAPRRPVYSQQQTPSEIPAHVRAAIERGGGQAVQLRFDHRDWPVATSVALALQRARLEFSVDPEWSFLFGARHGAARGIQTWRFIPAGQVPGALPLTRELDVLIEPIPGD